MKELKKIETFNFEISLLENVAFFNVWSRSSWNRRNDSNTISTHNSEFGETADMRERLGTIERKNNSLRRTDLF